MSPSRSSRSGRRPRRGGRPFSILRFAEPDLPDVVYLEQLTSALYLDKRETVDHYMAVMERLCLEAAPAAATCQDHPRDPAGSVTDHWPGHHR